MIQRILIYLFGLNYRTSIGAIFTVITLIPGAIAVIVKMYEGIVIFPPWIMIVSAVCTFIGIIYTGIVAKSKSVTGINGSAKMESSGQMMSKKDMLGGSGNG